MAAKQQQTGMTEVFLVAAELSALGLIVSPTSRSAFGADLLVTTADCSRAWSVQVKANRSTFGFWLLSEKSMKLKAESHVYVFVNFRRDRQHKFFIVPSAFVAENVEVQPTPKGTWYSFGGSLAEKYRDNWGEFAIGAAAGA
jgi:hypothetical protein